MSQDELDEFITDLGNFEEEQFDLINQAIIRYKINQTASVKKLTEKFEEGLIGGSVYDEWLSDDYQSRYNDWKSDQRRG